MRLTTKSEYGLRVLRDLVRNWHEGGNAYIQVGEMAGKYDTSAKYLEQVLLPLSYAGILESKRGQRGGYRLNRDPREVSLADVFRLLEGLLMPIPKWAEESSGEKSPLAGVLRRVRSAMRNILENTTIDVLVDDGCASGDDETPSADMMYYI